MKFYEVNNKYKAIINVHKASNAMELCQKI